MATVQHHESGYYYCIHSVFSATTTTTLDAVVMLLCMTQTLQTACNSALNHQLDHSLWLTNSLNISFYMQRSLFYGTFYRCIQEFLCLNLDNSRCEELLLLNVFLTLFNCSNVVLYKALYDIYISYGSRL